jgi:hypothetical protein
MSLALPHVRLVVCEGAHDLWVMQRALEVLHGYHKLKTSLGELPQPLGTLITGQVERHYLSVQASRVTPETPHFSLALKHPSADFILAFFTANGGIVSNDCKTWLADLRAALGTRLRTRGSGHRMESASVSVVVDADDDPKKVRKEVEAWWFGGAPEAAQAPNTIPITYGGLWTWPDGKGAQHGTLEQVLDNVDGGCGGTPAREIVELLNTHAPTDCKYIRKAAPVVAAARQIKARLGVQAQWVAPGGSWATWLRDVGLSADYVKGSNVLNALARWLVEGAPSSMLEDSAVAGC